MRLAILFLALFLGGCGLQMQHDIIMKCLTLCKEGDAPCINACGKLLSADCK